MSTSPGGSGDFLVTDDSPGNDTFDIMGSMNGSGTGQDAFQFNNTGNGNDSFLVTGGVNDAGPGNDTFLISNPGNGNETYTIDGGVTLGSGQDLFAINNSGNGNQTITINGPVTLGNANDTFFTISQYGNGNDTYTINGGVTAGPGNDFFTLGEAGTGTDLMKITGPVVLGAGTDSIQINGSGTGNETFDLPGGVTATGYDTYTISDPGAVTSSNETFTVDGNFGGMGGNNTFIVTSGLISIAGDGTDTFTLNGNLQGGSGFNTFSITNSGDSFTLNGALVGGTNDTSDTFELAGLYKTVAMTSGTGTGADTYEFDGGVKGDLVMTAPNNASRVDTLDFSSLDTGINLDISSTLPQTVAPGLTLQLSDGNGISDVIGTAYNDTIHGNARSNALFGSNSLDSNYDPNAPGPGSNGKVQVVLLDFDTAYNQAGGVYNFNTYYGRGRRDALARLLDGRAQAILQGIQANYAALPDGVVACTGALGHLLHLE